MLVGDAWIELADKLCKVKRVDTSYIRKDSVVERLKKLNLEKIDEKIFDLAMSSFKMNNKRHNRNIEQRDAIACVISSIVSMQTVIQEVLNAPG